MIFLPIQRFMMWIRLMKGFFLFLGFMKCFIGKVVNILKKMQDIVQIQEQKNKAGIKNKEFIDVQYQIWNTFMKSTGDELRNKEMKIMLESSKLLDQFQNSKSLFRESCSTEDISSVKNTFSDRESSTRPNSPDGRVFLRKSPRGLNKGFNFMFLEEMKDIEANCHPETIKSIQGLVCEYRKLKDASVSAEATQKRMGRKLEALEKDHEHLLILKKVNEEMDKKTQSLQIENQQLRKKNKQLYEKIDKMKSTKSQSAAIDTLGVINIAKFLNDKEKNINQKMSRVESIQKNILDVVSSQINDFGCDKCCTFVRKIKESIMRLRRSLLDESEQIQTIYNRYKAMLCPGSY